MLRRFFDQYKGVIVWIIVVGFFLGGGALAAFRYMDPSRNSSQPTKKVAITVNDENINQSKLDSTYENLVERQKQLYQQYGRDFSQQLKGSSGAYLKLDLKSRVAESLIRQELLAQKAEARNIDPSAKKINQQFNNRVNQILSQRNWTKDQLKQVLKRNGLTYSQFEKSTKNQIEQDLEVQQLREQVVGEVDPSEEQLRSYYENNRQNYVQTPAQVLASHIVTQTQTEAREIRSQIIDGSKDFSEVAENTTENPDLGWFSKKDQGRIIADTAFNLKVGEISEPIMTSKGWELIKLRDRKEANYQEFEAVKSKITQAYTQQERSKRFEDWYQEQKDSAQITIKRPLLRAKLQESQSLDEAIDNYEKLLQSGEVRDPYLPYYLGRVYEKKISQLRQPPEGAGKEQQEQLKDQISTLKAKAVRRYMETVRNAAQDDAELLRRVLQLDENNAEANFYLAEILSNQSRFNQALSRYRKALEINSGYVQARLGYGDLLMRLGNPTKAANQYRQALEIEGTNQSIKNKLARAHLEAENYALAESTYKEVLEESPENFTALVGLGDLYRKQENYPEAINYYQDALEVGSGTETQLNLGFSHLKTGNLDKAKETFNRVISIDPYNARAYLGLGDVYKNKVLNDEALSNYRDGLARTQESSTRIDLARRILSLDNTDQETRFTLAQTYFEGHRYKEAVEQYQKILSSNPEKGQRLSILKKLGEAYASRTEYEKAKEYYLKGLKESQSETDKLDFYKGIIKSDEGIYEGGKYSEEGLNAILQSAKINLNQGNKNKARSNLEKLKNADPDYKPEEVSNLLEKAKASEGSE